MPARPISRLVGWRSDLWNYYVSTLRRHLPGGLRRVIGGLYRPYALWRIGPQGTRLFGPRYSRSRDRIEIDITWDCNLHCFDCNRSCQQAPTKERMTIGQIRRFLEETRERNVRWENIGLIGGEPTLHPEFDEILRIVLEFRDLHSPDSEISVSSNGFGPEVNSVLARIPVGVVVHNTHKTSREQDEFLRYNLAPCESQEYSGADFRNACSIGRDCGIGLTPYGYYPCCGAGSIDRIFGFNCGRKTLPDPEDDMHEDLARFCSLCGVFRLNCTSVVCADSLTSPIWERAYAAWKENPTTLTRYPESLGG